MLENFDHKSFLDGAKIAFETIINAFNNGRLQNIEDRFPSQYFTRPPLCMPDEYKSDDYVQSYRNYYIGDKKNHKRHYFRG